MPATSPRRAAAAEEGPRTALRRREDPESRCYDRHCRAWPVRASASGGLRQREARAKRRRRALKASGILRCQWPLKPEGQDDVDETADGLWRAREDTSWEALLLRLDTSFAAIETEHSRQWRRVLAR